MNIHTAISAFRKRAAEAHQKAVDLRLTLFSIEGWWSLQRIEFHLCPGPVKERPKKPLRRYSTQKPLRRDRDASRSGRTPGDDLSLVTGFLFTENLIDHFKDIKTYKFCGRPAPHGTDPVAILCLNRLPTADDTQIRRNFVSHGGCGLCGKASLESISINQLSRLPAQELKFPTDLSILLPEILGQMRRNQKLFRQTGGLHGSAIFSRCGDILCLKEDIGRHNALDKTIGWMLAHYPEELPTGILLLSGRVSWELMQKAIRAQIPCVIAVGAPSSMAVEMARYFNVSLIGFAKPESFNIYHNNGYILEAR